MKQVRPQTIICSTTTTSFFLSVCPMCDEHDPTKQVAIGLADTGAGLVCMCCRLDCLTCGMGYTACDCTEYPRDPRRHPYADSEEIIHQRRPMHRRQFDCSRCILPYGCRRCPVCYRKHTFYCPRCCSTLAKASEPPPPSNVDEQSEKTSFVNVLLHPASQILIKPLFRVSEVSNDTELKHQVSVGERKGFQNGRTNLNLIIIVSGLDSR